MSDAPPPPPPPESFGSPPPPGRSADIGAALSYGWKKFTENVGALIAIVVVPIVVILVIDAIAIVVVRNFFGILLLGAVGLLVAMIAYLGIFNAGLMATRGERVDFGKAFTTDRWGEWIGFALVYGLMVAIGYAICYVGALVVIAFWGLAPFYFLDQRMGIGEALSASLAATRSQGGLALALAVVALVGAAGGLVRIGWLVTFPLAIVAAAFLYRGAANQPVAP